MHYCEKRMDGKKQNEIKQWGREIKSMHTDWFISLTRWIKKSFFFYMQRNAGKYAKLPQSTSFFYFMKFECKQTIFLWYLQVGCLIYLEKKTLISTSNNLESAKSNAANARYLHAFRVKLKHQLYKVSNAFHVKLKQ